MISKNLVQSLKNGSVLVVGDIMLDRYIEGDITRISPEVPIPILDRQNERCMLGGAGNVVANLRSFNCTVGLIGTGKTVSFEAIAKKIAKKYKAEIREIPMPDNIREQYQEYTCADLTKIKKHIGPYPWKNVLRWINSTS